MDQLGPNGSLGWDWVLPTVERGQLKELKREVTFRC